eukprot:scaffold22293_cov54-Cyclotella_meneghiniana.AAC.4
MTWNDSKSRMNEREIARKIIGIRAIRGVLHGVMGSSEAKSLYDEWLNRGHGVKNGRMVASAREMEPVSRILPRGISVAFMLCAVDRRRFSGGQSAFIHFHVGISNIGWYRGLLLDFPPGDTLFLSLPQKASCS